MEQNENKIAMSNGTIDLMDDGDVDYRGSVDSPAGGAHDSALAKATALAALLKAEAEGLTLSLANVEARLKTVQGEIMRTLEAMEIDSLKMNGFTFYVEEKESVKTPKTLEEKALFFEYLRQLGLFDEMVGVNSQTLNSFYRAKSEEALGQGVLEFRMPGIEPPTSYKQLKMRKA